MYHYKDQKPINTVNTIRKILSRIELMPTEQWMHLVDNVYSVRLSLPKVKIDIGTNGKGKTRELALASAYGEFIERLQNQILYPVFNYYEFDEALKKYGGFIFDPNEKKLKASKIFTQIPKRILQAMSIEKSKDLFESSSSDFLKHDDEFISVPYYDFSINSIIYFPIMFVFYYYGSNGMASGNTMEEALVQGISEVIERYVIRKLLISNITPPDIIRKDLQKYFPDEYIIIESIENQGDFQIIVKDCSLGYGLPVIGIILLNKKDNVYFVKFGSHPDLCIALERALLELLQGRDIRDFHNLTDFKVFLNEQSMREDSNFHKIFVNGTGDYPIYLFKSNFTYSANKIAYSQRFSSNRDCLSYLLGTIKRMDWILLVRDVSFLGFPTINVIIPGISELNNFKAKDFKFLQEYLIISQMMRKISEQSNDGLKMIINFMEKRKSYGYSNALESLMHIPLSKDCVLSKINQNVFLTIAYHKIGDLQQAYSNIDKYINSDRNNKGDLLSYYRCTRDFLALMIRGNTMEESDQILKVVYREEITEKVRKDFSHPGEVFKEMGVLNCPECITCKYRYSCSYDEIKNIHMRIKNLLAKNTIDTVKLTNLFDTFK